MAKPKEKSGKDNIAHREVRKIFSLSKTRWGELQKKKTFTPEMKKENVYGVFKQSPEIHGSGLLYLRPRLRSTCQMASVLGCKLKERKGRLIGCDKSANGVLREKRPINISQSTKGLETSPKSGFLGEGSQLKKESLTVNCSKIIGAESREGWRLARQKSAQSTAGGKSMLIKTKGEREGEHASCESSLDV